MQWVSTVTSQIQGPTYNRSPSVNRMNKLFRAFAVAITVSLAGIPVHASEGRLLTEPATGMLDGSYDSVALATDGQNVLVAWESTRLAGREEVRAPGIFATVVQPDGRLRGTTPIALFIEPAYAWLENLSASWDGATYTITWDVFVPLEGSYVARISAEGEIVQTSTRVPERRATQGTPRRTPQVVESTESEVVGTIQTSSGTFVVQRETSDFSSRLTGTFQGSGVSTILTIGPHSQVSALTSGDGFYLTAWVESSSPHRVYCGRVAANGSPLDGRGILLGEASAPAIAAAFDGQSFVVTWAGTQSLEARRVELDGSLGPILLIAATPSRFVRLSLSSNGTNTLLAWNDRDIHGALLNGTSVTQLGVISPAVETGPDGIYTNHAPQLAWTGDHWLLTWTERARPCRSTALCPGTETIKFARIGSDGRTLDARAVPVGTPVPFGQIIVFLTSSGVSSSGRESLIVWDNPDGDVRGARVNLNGQLTDPAEGFVIDSWKSGRTFSGPDPNVLWTGNSYTVVWNRYYPHANSTGLVARRIGDAVSDPVRAITPVAFRWTDNAQIARDEDGAVLIANDEIRLDTPFLGSSLTVGYFASELPGVPQPPLAPTGVKAKVDGNSVAVTWSDVADNEAGYIVEVQYLYGAERVRLSADSQSALVATGLSFNVPEELRIWAYNQGGESPTVTIQLEPADRRIRRNR